MAVSSRRVVVTGVGVINAAFTGSSVALGAYLANPSVATGPVAPAALAALIDEGEGRRLSRVSQLTVAAARLAAREGGCEGGADLGVVVGTEFGDLQSTREFADGFLARGPAGLSPLLFPNTVMNTMGSAAAIALAAQGLSLTLNAPGVAGELAILRAAAAVAGGRAERVLAGGVDQLDARRGEMLAWLGAGQDRTGEGATFLVLEALDAAVERGARILGEILGGASGALAARPHGIGRSAASGTVSRALARAAVRIGDIGWIYASASGDRPRDAWERALLEKACGPGGPAMASLAGFVGHHAGLGAMRVAAAAWTARTGLLPMIDDPAEDGSPVSAIRMERVGSGPGLVHGVARGGTHVALVVGPPPTS